jgi:hypothetical protein
MHNPEWVEQRHRKPAERKSAPGTFGVLGAPCVIAMSFRISSIGLL